MEIIKKYFPDLSEKQINQFACLKDLYENWNEKINVISRKDIDSLYERHVLHSLAIAKVINFVPGTSVLDIGTGGGFPGIPLAIMFPDTQFHLVDSIGKKITVVNGVAEALGLKNIKGEHARVEKLKDKYDFIVSRAVTNFPDFVRLIRNKILLNNKNSFKNGLLYIKGGDFMDEIKDYKDKITIYEIKDFFSEEFFDTKKVIYYAM